MWTSAHGSGVWRSLTVIDVFRFVALGLIQEYSIQLGFFPLLLSIDPLYLGGSFLGFVVTLP